MHKSKKSIFKEQLGSKRIHNCWILRLSPGGSLWTQIVGAKIPKNIFTIIMMNIIGQILMLLSWFIIGKGAFKGNFDPMWLYALTLLMFTAIPFQLITTWAGSLMSISAGEIFKKRLLFGILKLEPEEIKNQGAGQFLGRVMESESVESLALTGGIVAIISIIDLFTAVTVIKMGIGGWLHTFILFGWIIISIFLYIQYFRKINDWMNLYQEMTNDMVERMVGHRTRLAQEDEKDWHNEEDKILSKYFQLSEDLDKVNIKIHGIVSHGWGIVGFLGIAYLIIIIPPASKSLMAVSIGGIMLASQALTSIVGTMSSIVNITIAWKQVGPLFTAANRKKYKPSSFVISNNDLKKKIDEDDEPVLAAYDINFNYGNYGRSIITNCSLKISKGDRLLLEGPSGGGKSTLSALIAGLKEPVSGILLMGGLDKQTMGIDEWRKRIVIAPQFHENHVLMETFAFNLLMGRRWPPSNEDLEHAEEICQELGLGELLHRMPAGIQQMVGESGWRLSHGERSRLYIARALLQEAEIIILDESFAALDPENLYRAMNCVLKRASTLLVIAHP
ncbi:MAG: ABC transporter ATP-binding protein [Desulfobacterales bacterium]|nr:ABC transporter ATP-binding protein [Desulfobacterales bacterium]